MSKDKQYILRDAVHMDIVFPRKYYELINTKEFQRLSRIKQLSCEYLVFPTAVHTRFSHGIGTYNVMNQLIKRLEDILSSYDIIVTEQQKDLALVSALIHDIGHGPFSHTFERIFKLGDHENWTLKIIKDQNTEINKSLIKNFGKDFPEKLIAIFNNETKSQENINTLISQLVSSQIDADRMDYLLRDSYFTSISNGKYDLARLINAIDVIEIEGKLNICVNEKYLSSVEEYILARYFMHKEAYQHPIKRQMENILCKVFERARELYAINQLELQDEVLIKLLMNENLNVTEYISLDDSFFYYHINKWKENKDYILATLATSFIDRKKFTKYRFENKDNSLEKLLLNVLKEKAIKSDKKIYEECFYIKDIVEFSLYNPNKENIWVKCKNGEIKDISEVSYLINAINLNKKYTRTTEYLHQDLLEFKYKINIGAH